MDHTPFASTGLYYRHSGRFSPAGVVKAFALGTLAAVPLGAAYAYIELYNPIVYVTFLVIGGTGFLLGWLIGTFIKSGKIRNVPVAMLIAAYVAALMFVSCWEVWLFAVLQRAGANPFSLLDIVAHPGLAWEILVVVNDKGAWSLDNSTPTGLMLDLFWASEAAVLLGLPLWIAWKTVREAPFCEKCGQWCPSRDILCLNPGDAAAIRARLEARDFAALAALGKASPAAMHFWNLYFQGCADCDTTQTLCLDETVITVDRRGKMRTTKKPIVSRLLLTPDDTVAVATAAALLSLPEPAPAAPPAPAPPQDPPATSPNTTA